MSFGPNQTTTCSILTALKGLCPPAQGCAEGATLGSLFASKPRARVPGAFAVGAQERSDTNRFLKEIKAGRRSGR
ncbi:MAG: hypothetical protein MI923_05230 [Phycisphaerales bacterium]|nr:hypothetical protein [Phycisphaerales bacterium]